MKRSLITSSLAALGVAFLLPLGASAATVTNATAAKHTTTAKSATAAKSTTAARTSAKTESATPATNATATKSARHHATAKNASATKTTKIDINTATREELMTLPGIDGAMADKIIEGRPYKNMAQLKTKGGVTNAEYRKISRKVTARQSTMHSEAPANGTQNMESGAQNEAGGDGAAAASGSSETTK